MSGTHSTLNRVECGLSTGSEVAPTNPGDIFAALSAFTPIQFPTTRPQSCGESIGTRRSLS